MNSIDLIELKAGFPLPRLLEHLGLQHCAKASCKSPLRTDHNASWGIYQHRGLWFWKDHGNNDGGDEIDFLARYLRLDGRQHFPLLLLLYEALADEFIPTTAGGGQESIDRAPPEKTGYSVGNPDQIQRLASLRGISQEALEYAQKRGVLIFGTFAGCEVYGVTDQSGNVLEVRRLDGEVFEAYQSLGERKSHAVKGSQKSWPVGIMESLPFPKIALVEGVPDFLATHDFILREHGEMKELKCAVVAMLSASVLIADEALPFFANKLTVIYPHADQPGVQAATRWKQQIESAGGKVALFDMTQVHGLTAGKVSDLNDLLRHDDPTLFEKNPSLKQIMPG